MRVCVKQRHSTRDRACLMSASPALGFWSMKATAVMMTAFETQDRKGMVVHLVNASGTLEKKQGEMVSHHDPIPFPKHTGERIRITIRKPDAWSGQSVTAAKFHDPEMPGAVSLKVEDRSRQVCVEVDPRLVGKYGLVILNG